MDPITTFELKITNSINRLFPNFTVSKFMFNRKWKYNINTWYGQIIAYDNKKPYLTFRLW